MRLLGCGSISVDVFGIVPVGLFELCYIRSAREKRWNSLIFLCPSLRFTKRISSAKFNLPLLAKIFGVVVTFLDRRGGRKVYGLSSNTTLLSSFSTAITAEADAYSCTLAVSAPWLV